MTLRRLALVAGSAAVACLLLLLLPRHTGAPVDRWNVAAASQGAPGRVRIEHEIVRIPVTAATIEPRPARVGALGRGRGAAPAQAARATDEPDRSSGRRDDRDPGAKGERGLWSRTVQTIVGDGRHRPQPFPRLR